MHTWIMTGDPQQNFIRRMAIELPLAGAAGELDHAFGGPCETEGTPVVHDPADPPYVPLELGQHWGAYLASYGIPSIALIHHYYLTGEGRDLDAAQDYVDETPQSAFGRATYDSGMGLMMRDIQTGGEQAVRERLRTWAELDEATAAYLRGYLESVEGQGTYLERIGQDWDAAFPADPIQAHRYEDWAARIPADFRDAFSADIMPDGPWSFPLRTLESMQFDGPGGMGNDLGRHSNQLSLMWLMPHVPPGG